MSPEVQHAYTLLQLAQNLVEELTAENARLRLERDAALLLRGKVDEVAQRVQRLEEKQAQLWS